MKSERRRKRAVVCLFCVAALVGCEDLMFETGRTPTVDGVWEGAVGLDGTVELVLVEVSPQEVRGNGHLTLGDASIPLDATGVHRFPSVSLTLASDSLLLNLTGMRSEWTEPLRFGVDRVTILGELNGAGFVGEPVELVRRDPVGEPPD